MKVKLPHYFRCSNEQEPCANQYYSQVGKSDEKNRGECEKRKCFLSHNILFYAILVMINIRSSYILYAAEPIGQPYSADGIMS